MDRVRQEQPLFIQHEASDTSNRQPDVPRNTGEFLWKIKHFLRWCCYKFQTHLRFQETWLQEAAQVRLDDHLRRKESAQVKQ
jgi:hypothetical protein